MGEATMVLDYSMLGHGIVDRTYWQHKEVNKRR